MASVALVAPTYSSRTSHRLPLVLGGSGVVLSRVISRVTIVITYVSGLITLLITTPGPPSRARNSRGSAGNLPPQKGLPPGSSA